MPDGGNLNPGMLRQDHTDGLLFSRIGDLWEQAEVEVVGTESRKLTLQEAQQVARTVQKNISIEAGAWGLEFSQDLREKAADQKVFSLGVRNGTYYNIVLQGPGMVQPHVHPKKPKDNPIELRENFQTIQFWLGRMLSGWWWTGSEKPDHPNNFKHGGRLEKLTHRLRTPNDGGDAHGGSIDESAGWVAFCAGTPGRVDLQTSDLEPETQAAMRGRLEAVGMKVQFVPGVH